ncbi:MAG: amidase [Opitutales bacterium]
MTTIPESFAQWQEAALAAPEKLASGLLERIEALPRDVGYAVFAHTPDAAALSEALEKVLRTESALKGLPTAVKDLFDWPGLPTKAGSRFLTKERPDTSAGSAVQRLMEASGLVHAGKTHLNEFAYGLSGENLHFGRVPHPTRPEGGRLSGGSSSGSAYVVGAGLMPLAFGTDTGGSVRVPAGFCGIYGVRLTPNHPLSKEGCFPLSPLFDTCGWFTRQAADMLQALDVLLPEAEGARAAQDVQLRGAYLPELTGELAPEVRSALDALAAKLLDTSVTEDASDELTQQLKELNGTFSTIQSHDACKVHEPWLDRRKADYDPVVWERIDRGRRWTSKQLEAAEKRREAVQGLVATYFETHDVLLIPTAPGPSPLPEENDVAFRMRLLDLGATGSLCGLPALSVPATLPDGLTVGLQVLFKSIESAPWKAVLNRLS